MLREEAHEPPATKQDDGNRLIHVTRPGVPPRTMSVVDRESSAFGVEPKCAELCEPGTRTLPLLPQDATQFPTDPRIEFLKARLHSGQTEIRDPPTNNRGELLDDAAEMSASAPSQ